MHNTSCMIQNSVELNKPFIGLSIQHRLLAYAFINSKEVIEAEVTDLGVRDQRLALQWVRENIGAFGGDPSRTTIFGEATSALSIGFHLTAFGGRDDQLFPAAIIESGCPFLLGSKYDAGTEQAKQDKLIAATSCSSSEKGTLQCLRDLPYAVINAALNGAATRSFYPYLDGDLIQGSLHEQLETGAFVKVPIIAGTNSDEGAFTAIRANINTDDEFRRQAAAYGSESTAPFLEALYPNIPGAGNSKIWTTPSAGHSF